MNKYAAFIALAALITAGAIMLQPRAAKAEATPRVVEVHAKRFGFTPDQIKVKKGETVKIHLVSEDVTHGFFSKPLKVDEVVSPDAPADITVTPTETGKYTIICDHFCGAGHGNMGMSLVVED